MRIEVRAFCVAGLAVPVSAVLSNLGGTILQRRSSMSTQPSRSPVVPCSSCGGMEVSPRTSSRF